MRLLVHILGIALLSACVGPTPPPPPAYALRVLDAETVVFRADFRRESPERAVEAAMDELGWSWRRTADAGWHGEASGLVLACGLRGEKGRREVLLGLRERAPTASLEEQGRLLVRALRDREGRR